MHTGSMRIQTSRTIQRRLRRLVWRERIASGLAFVLYVAGATLAMHHGTLALAKWLAQ